MPNQGFTVGRDITTTIATSSDTLAPAGITSFTKKQDVTQKKVKLITGITKTLTFPDGWSGQFVMSRMDSSIDDYIATSEANYFAGSDTDSITITETIVEQSGAVSQYQYTGVTVALENGGNAAGDTEVEQTLSWIAERRIKLS
ncbi:hypothetical protein ACQUFY_20805 [Robbsia andropogonis]|uniref:hypothetical protein n=1 Tax=Robbsia andropogonis TaxID=28092 RepID=UPI003D1E42F2